MIKAVLFDLDGTLLDRDASVKSFINSQYERLNESVGQVLKVQYVSRFIELDCRGYVWKDKVYQQMVAEFNITGLTWEQLLRDYMNHFKEHCVPFPNLHKMLTTLANQSIILGIISNGKEHFQMDNIIALGIKDYFDTILISEKVGVKKPDPRIFKNALEQLNVSANESLFVGDHPVTDVKASQGLGMLAAWKKDSQWKEVDADFIVYDLMDVPIVVESLKKGLAITEPQNRNS